MSVYSGQVIGQGCAHASTQAIGLSLPLFAGAQLRASQKLCATGPYSVLVDVAQPEEWPLGVGSFKAGSGLVVDVPVSPANTFQEVKQGPCAGGIDDLYDFKRPAANKAVIVYPATVDGLISRRSPRRISRRFSVATSRAFLRSTIT